jgi:hypothetical protein
LKRAVERLSARRFFLRRLRSPVDPVVGDDVAAVDDPDAGGDDDDDSEDVESSAACETLMDGESDPVDMGDPDMADSSSASAMSNEKSFIIVAAAAGVLRAVVGGSDLAEAALRGLGHHTEH